MNARQAAKAAARRIEELEYANQRYKLDVVAYNAVIEGTTEGKTICAWCAWRDHDPCPGKEKKGGTGCREWGLAFDIEEESENHETETDGTAAGAGDGAVAAASGISIEGVDYDLGHMQAGVGGQHPGEAQQPQ